MLLNLYCGILLYEFDDKAFVVEFEIEIKLQLFLNQMQIVTKPGYILPHSESFMSPMFDRNPKLYAVLQPSWD